MVKLYKTQKRRRKAKIKHKVHGTSARPRISVFRSNKYIYAQAVDDEKMCTIASSSSLSPVLRKVGDKKKRLKISYVVGKELGEILKKAKITKAVFDRGPYRYHGCVEQLVKGVRESGIKL